LAESREETNEAITSHDLRHFGVGASLESLYAQTQSQPQPVACPLEGPSIADTLKYLNDVLAVVKITNTNTTLSKYSLSISGEELILSSYLQSANSANMQLRLFVNQLDCHPGTTFLTHRMGEVS
jgi:hypothetical protein